MYVCFSMNELYVIGLSKVVCHIILLYKTTLSLCMYVYMSICLSIPFYIKNAHILFK